MAETKEKLVSRSRKVAFMGVTSGTGGSGTETFHRMTKFTDMSKSSNPAEYSRQYVDEDGEVTDVTGYSPEISYAFDMYENNAVHNDIIDITDNEKMGDDAVRNIIVVDFTRPVEEQQNQYYARSARMRSSRILRATARMLTHIPVPSATREHRKRSRCSPATAGRHARK